MRLEHLERLHAHPGHRRHRRAALQPQDGLRLLGGLVGAAGGLRAGHGNRPPRGLVLSEDVAGKVATRLRL